MEDVVVIEVDIFASPERVFRALSDQREIAAWWTEGGAGNWEMDSRVGGKWRSEGSDESCGAWQLGGEITQFEPPRMLEYTWSERVEYRSSAEATIVRYELEPIESGTRVRVTHSGFGADAAARESYRGGWPVVLEQLRQYAETQAESARP